MKRVFCIIFCVFLIFCMSSCEEKEGLDGSYADDYNEGYLEGVERGKSQIVNIVEDQYSNIYSSELENAVTILEMYADGVYEDENGHPISEDELQEAVALLLEYKNNVDKIIYNIDDIEIY